MTLSDVRKRHKSNKIVPILSAPKLLASELRQEQIQEIKRWVDFTDDRFNALCLPVMQAVVLSVQELPETRNSYFSNRGGYATHLFGRCLTSLKGCRDYFLNEEGQQANRLSEAQLRWIYCLFSAALLQGLGKLVTDFHINLYDGAANSLGLWRPLVASMSNHGASYYDYDFDNPYQDTFRERATVALAMRLMPKAGLHYLSENKPILEAWLAMLSGDVRGAGGFGLLLDRTDINLINRDLLEQAAKEFGAKKTIAGLLGERLAESEQDKVLAEGELPKAGAEFIKWLSRALGKAQLMVNQSPLLAVPGGLLMSPDILKMFVNEHPQFGDWQSVEKSLIQMQRHVVGTGGAAVQHFTHHRSGQGLRGVVLPPGVAIGDAGAKLMGKDGQTINLNHENYINVLSSGETQYRLAASSQDSSNRLSLLPTGQWSLVQIVSRGPILGS